MECDICYTKKKVVKCNKCNFFICQSCMIKLEHKNINNKLFYSCCVCKFTNHFYIQKLNKDSLIEYVTKLNEKKDIPKSIEIINYNETPVIIFNIPVFANKVHYHNKNIVLIKTSAIYNYIHYTIDTDALVIPTQKLVSEEQLFKYKKLQPLENYYYFKCFNESEYGLIDYKKLYQIIQNGYAENFN